MIKKPEKRPMDKNGYQGIGNEKNYCKSCGYFLAECVCEGFNEAIEEYEAYHNEVVTKLKQKIERLQGEIMSEIRKNQELDDFDIPIEE